MASTATSSFLVPSRMPLFLVDHCNIIIFAPLLPRLHIALAPTLVNIYHYLCTVFIALLLIPDVVRHEY